MRAIKQCTQASSTPTFPTITPLLHNPKQLYISYHKPINQDRGSDLARRVPLPLSPPSSIAVDHAERQSSVEVFKHPYRLRVDPTYALLNSSGISVSSTVPHLSIADIQQHGCLRSLVDCLLLSFAVVESMVCRFFQSMIPLLPSFWIDCASMKQFVHLPGR